MYKYTATLNFETERPMSISEVRRTIEGAVQSESNGSHPEDPIHGAKKIKVARVTRTDPHGGSVA